MNDGVTDSSRFVKKQFQRVFNKNAGELFKPVSQGGLDTLAGASVLLVPMQIQKMCRKYKFHEKDGAYFISFATVFWIDLFTRMEYFDIMISSLDYCRKIKE